MTKDIYESSPDLYQKISEDDDKIYYFLPHTGKYIGVRKARYYCHHCYKVIPVSEVTIDVRSGTITHKSGKRTHSVIVQRGQVCEARACPLCGKPCLKEDDPESFGYCSPEHRFLELQRLTRVVQRVDKEDKNV